MLYPITVLLTFLTLGFRRLRAMLKANTLITTIILIVFFLGILELLNLPQFLINIIIEALVVIFFSISFYKSRNRKFRTPGMIMFLMFTSVVIVSVILNSSDKYQSYLYYRFFLSPFLFMLAVVNMRVKEAKAVRIVELMEYLFIFQIVATFIKLLILGIPEHPVGTIIVAGGGVATYIPLIAAGFLLSRYFIHEKKLYYILLLFIFPIIAYASQKRGTFFLLPAVFVAFIVLLGRVDRRYKSIDKRLKYIVSLLGISLLILMIGAKNIRLMNPEGSRRGSFDVNYLIESSIEYNSLEGRYTYGRSAAFKRINQIIAESERQNQLVGFGPETLKGFSRGDGKMERFGVGGTFPGISYQFIQIGVLGALFWLFLYLIYGFLILKALRKERDTYWRSIGLGTLVMIVLFLIDYFTYSIAFLTVYAFTFTIALGFGLTMNRYYTLKALRRVK
jgi:hypothetical protein